jgi:hypothetical protein
LCAIFKPRFAFQQWNRGYCWNKNLKMHLSDWAQRQIAIDGINFKNEWRAETLPPGLEFDNFEPRHKNGVLKYISWLNGLFMRGDDRGFLKEGVNTFLMAPRSPLNTSTISGLHIYSLWFEHVRRWPRERTQLFVSMRSGRESFRKRLNSVQNDCEFASKRTVQRTFSLDMENDGVKLPMAF